MKILKSINFNVLYKGATYTSKLYTFWHLITINPNNLIKIYPINLIYDILFRYLYLQLLIKCTYYIKVCYEQILLFRFC